MSEDEANLSGQEIDLNDFVTDEGGIWSLRQLEKVRGWNNISNMDEVQAVEIKPLAFGMMFIEVQAVLGEGEGIVDGFESRVRDLNPLIGQIEALEMGRL